MTLADLVGEHELTGVDCLEDAAEDAAKDQNVCIFVLDGIAYVAEEDPEDGYRSYMRELRLADAPVKNSFPPVKVIGSMRRPGVDQDEVLELRDAITTELVLAIGTMNTDDYYPWCTIEFHPEAMSMNRPRS